MPGSSLLRWLLVSLFLFSLPTQAAKLIVSAFGDSITRGYPYQQSQANGIPNNGGYIPYLQLKLISEKQWDVSVLNYGHPGELVTTSGFHRFDDGYTYPVLDSEPDYVLIMEGTNDLPWGIGPSAVRDKLSYAVDKVLADKRIPILGTLIPRYDGNSWTNISGTNDLIRSLATSKGIQLADLYRATSSSYWPIYLTSDNLHPNLNGYSLIANTWSGALIQAKAIQDEIQRQIELELELERQRLERAAAVASAVSLLLLE